MQLRNYRLTVVGCALSWLLVGLHLPTLHEVLDQYTYYGVICTMNEQLPRESNRVTLASETDANGLPVAQLEIREPGTRASEEAKAP